MADVYTLATAAHLEGRLSDEAYLAYQEVLQYGVIVGENKGVAYQFFAPPALPYQETLVTNPSAIRAELRQYLASSTHALYDSEPAQEHDLDLFGRLYLDLATDQQFATLYIGLTLEVDPSIPYLLQTGFLSPEDSAPLPMSHRGEITYIKFVGILRVSERQSIIDWAVEAQNRPDRREDVQRALALAGLPGNTFAARVPSMKAYQVKRSIAPLASRQALQVWSARSPIRPTHPDG